MNSEKKSSNLRLLAIQHKREQQLARRRRRSSKKASCSINRIQSSEYKSHSYKSLSHVWTVRNLTWRESREAWNRQGERRKSGVLERGLRGDKRRGFPSSFFAVVGEKVKEDNAASLWALQRHGETSPSATATREKRGMAFHKGWKKEVKLRKGFKWSAQTRTEPNLPGVSYAIVTTPKK